MQIRNRLIKTIDMNRNIFLIAMTVLVMSACGNREIWGASATNGKYNVL